MSDTIIGYHFSSDVLRNGDPIPPIGQWLKHEGDVKPCKSGLHASEHPFDALQWAPGSLLHRVELRGDLQSRGDPVDKWAGRERRILQTIDATDLLRVFARWCALQVMDFWDAPQVVHDYLKTGDECKRQAAGAAAWEAREAARAAREAAREAAWAAAWEAAWAAARAAQRDEFARLVDQAFKEVGDE